MYKIIPILSRYFFNFFIWHKQKSCQVVIFSIQKPCQDLRCKSLSIKHLRAGGPRKSLTFKALRLFFHKFGYHKQGDTYAKTKQSSKKANPERGQDP
jgi:hypothetical protein